MQVTEAHVKEKIKRSFNRAAFSYHDHAHLQRKIAFDLLHCLRLQTTHADNIVDFGCGTGISTQALISHFNFSHLVALDIADQLLAQAQQYLNQSSVIFKQGDFEQLNFTPNSLDLAFSNMAFHWSLSLENTLSRIATQLKHAGLLAFTLPVSGTFPELLPSSKNQFMNFEVISHLLTQLGFCVLVKKQKIYLDTFDSALSALRSLKAIGTPCLTQHQPRLTLQGLSGLDRIFKDPHNQQLTYTIGFFIAKKASMHVH